MKSFLLFETLFQHSSLVAASIALGTTAGCGGESRDSDGAAGTGTASGGTVGMGGAAATGGSATAGGAVGTGGSVATGGASGAGGAAATGGSATAGGAVGTGGSGGSVATGGASGASGGGGGFAGAARCEPQDATMTGGCEPAPRYVYNGIDCVPMSGCDCVGQDCDETYASADECKSAHAGCEGLQRSCSEIESVYNDYVSHGACSTDADCTVIFGGCGIGLGGCHHFVNQHWGETGLSSLVDAWSSEGCQGPVCDCIQPPSSSVCEDGVCVAQP